MADNDNFWYSQGLRFKCQRCGSCCSGAPGIVQFTEDEGRAMAEELGLPWEVFLDRLALKYNDHYFLKDVRCEYGFDCVLLSRDFKKVPTGCLAHKSRPSQCRTWPFWPENLYSPESWAEAAERCPGINRGRLYTFAEIEEELAKDNFVPCTPPPIKVCHTTISNRPKTISS